MKRRSIFTMFAAFFCVALVSANEPAWENPTKKITEQLQKILSINSINVEDKDATARVLFVVNEEGAIEVLEVASERRDVRSFLSKSLNGKKLSVDNISSGEKFVVDVRVKPE